MQSTPCDSLEIYSEYTRPVCIIKRAKKRRKAGDLVRLIANLGQSLRWQFTLMLCLNGPHSL